MRYDIHIIFLDTSIPNMDYVDVTYVIENGFLKITQPGPPPLITAYNLATLALYQITEHDDGAPPV